jgi:hypothetical protein
MKEIKKRSPIPLYGTAAIWVLCTLFMPLYKPSHFLYLILIGVASFGMLTRLFPGTVEQVKEPEVPFTTGNDEADALLREGETAVKELERLKNSINNPAVCEKIGTIQELTDRIFKDIIDDPSDIPQVKRFSNYYLPTTLKLLNAYDRMSSEKIKVDNITDTMSKIEDILDTTIEAYKKQLDALFYNQALDIETDIAVLEGMLKREGLTGKDF